MTYEWKTPSSGAFANRLTKDQVDTSRISVESDTYDNGRWVVRINSWPKLCTLNRAVS